MSMATIARVYAETLLRRAEAAGAVDEVSDGLELVAATLGADERFRRFVEAPQIATGDKREVLAETFGERVHPIALRFLELVVDKHREPLLPAIVATWRERLDERANRQAAVVTAARPVPDEVRERLVGALERATGKTIELEERHDPSLLGGLVVRTGDLVMDGSLRTRLVGLGRRLKAARVVGGAHQG